MSQALHSRDYSTTELRDGLDRLRRDLSSLVDLASSAAEDLTGEHYRQHKRWLATEAMEKRITFGQFLAPIFEEAFGSKITVNDWGSAGSNANAPTPFARFYLAMMDVVFGSKVATNLGEVLKEARARHRTKPLTLNSDID